MSPNDYAFKFDEFGNTKAILVYNRGFGLFGNSFTCKGTAYNEEERNQLDLDASVPPSVRTLSAQVANSVNKVNAKESDIEKFI